MDRTYTENFLMFSVLHRWVNESRSVMSDSLWPHGLYSPRNSPGQNTGVVAFSFSKGSSQSRDWTQVSRTAGGGGLYQLSLMGSPGTGKEPVCQCRKLKRWGFKPWSGRYPENQEDTSEEDMATNSSTLAWRIPWTEEPGRLLSISLQRVGPTKAT